MASSNLNIILPSPAVPFTNSSGTVTALWYSIFNTLVQRTGGGTPSANQLLDTITSQEGAMLYRSTLSWAGLAPGQQNQVLLAGTAAPAWGNLSGSNFGPESPNLVLASPVSGIAGTPSFRSLVSADLPLITGANFGVEPVNTFFAGPSSGGSNAPTFRAVVTADLVPIAGQFPATATNDNASSGNVGQYLNATATVASVVTATVTDIATLSLPPGDWDVWGNVESLPSTATVTSFSAWLNTTSATDPGFPNGGAYFLSPLSHTANLASPLGMMRLSLASTTTVYLSANATFTGTSEGVSGFIGARRAR